VHNNKGVVEFTSQRRFLLNCFPESIFIELLFCTTACEGMFLPLRADFFENDEYIF